MASVPLTWTLSIKGGEEVTGTLNELNASFKRGELTTRDYNKSLSQGNREAMRNINVGRYQNNIYISQHPNLLKISRALSTVTSITRSLLTITNALNISKIQGNQVDEAAESHKTKANEFMRMYNNLLAQGKGNTDEARSALEGYNTETALMNQRIQDVKDSNFNEIFVMITGSILAGAAAWSQLKGHLLDIKNGFNYIKNLIPLIFPVLLNSITAFLSNPAISQGIAFFASQFLGLIPGVKELRDSFAAWLKSLGEIDGRWIDTFVSGLNVSIPMAVGQAGLALSNFFLVDIKSWASNGINFIIGEFTKLKDIVLGIINSIINAIKSIVFPFGGGASGGSSIGLGAATISAQQALSNRTGITTYDTKGNISTTPTKRATGFEGMVNTPQLMMVGDAGPEYVSVTPHGGTRNGGGATIIVNIAGSVVTEKQLFSRLDDIQKNNLKRRGFTGT